VPRLLLKRKLRADTFRLLGALGRADHFACPSDLPFPPMKPDRFSTQSYRLPRSLRGAKCHRTRQDGRIGEYRACPRPAVGVLVSPPNLDALALLPGEDAEAVVLDLLQPVGSGGRRARVRTGGLSGAPRPAQRAGAARSQSRELGPSMIRTPTRHSRRLNFTSL
jgi:hypothetical protein